MELCGERKKSIAHASGEIQSNGCTNQHIRRTLRASKVTDILVSSWNLRPEPECVQGRLRHG